jgi:hypothetical protein
MQFYCAGSFAGNSGFKAVLAASPVLFTAHYRSVVPAHNTPNILAVNFSKFSAAIMSFCTSAPSWGIPYNPIFYLQC